MITKALLPPRKGYVERVNAQGEHYYHKVYTKVGTVHRRIVIDKDQIFNLKAIPNSYITVTLIGGGGLISTNINGSNSIIHRENIMQISSNTHISIGAPGEPTSFGTYLMSDAGISGGGNSISKPLVVDGIEYGRGETPDAPATNGVCIIEYDEVIYE